MEVVFLRPVDESDVVIGIDLQARQDRWQVVGDLSAFALNNGATPMDGWTVYRLDSGALEALGRDAAAM